MKDLHPDTSSVKIPPPVIKADNALGSAGVQAPWANSHQGGKKGSPHWQAHSQNSQGLSGQTDWQHKGSKRGGDAGPVQRGNPWSGMNQPNTPQPSQAADE